MTISDNINLLIVILTGVGVITSLLISVFTLRQSSKQAKESREMNEKKLEESMRPYLYLFIRSNVGGSSYGRIVLKNFGNSAAFIKSISPSAISLMPKLEDKINSKPFSNIAQSTFPPGYEIETVFEFDIVKDNPFYEMEVEYSSGTYNYKDVLKVNLRQGHGMFKLGPLSGRKHEDYMSESLQVIAQSLYNRL